MILLRRLESSPMDAVLLLAATVEKKLDIVFMPLALLSCFLFVMTAILDELHSYMGGMAVSSVCNRQETSIFVFWRDEIRMWYRRYDVEEYKNTWTQCAISLVQCSFLFPSFSFSFFFFSFSFFSSVGGPLHEEPLCSKLPYKLNASRSGSRRIWILYWRPPITNHSWTGSKSHRDEIRDIRNLGHGVRNRPISHHTVSAKGNIIT